MRIATGKVVDGKVVLNGACLDEGVTVAVLAPEDDETFELSPEEAARIGAAIAEADRGEGVDGDDLLDRISR